MADNPPSADEDLDEDQPLNRLRIRESRVIASDSEDENVPLSRIAAAGRASDSEDEDVPLSRIAAGRGRGSSP